MLSLRLCILSLLEYVCFLSSLETAGELHFQARPKEKNMLSSFVLTWRVRQQYHLQGEMRNGEEVWYAGASPLVFVVTLYADVEVRVMTDEQHQQQGIAPAKRGLRATRSSLETLHTLPTPVRPIVDPSDVKVPQGYTVEAILAGLSFPCGMGFTDDGTLFILEGVRGQHVPICLPAS
jgi:hypothetical protein